MQKRMVMAAALLSLVVSLVGCGTIQKVASKGVNVVASIGTNTLGLLDIGTPLVQDPAQPGDTNAVVVNPAIVGAAQGAATAFGGPYGVPIASTLGLVAGIAGMWITQARRRKTTVEP